MKIEAKILEKYINKVSFSGNILTLNLNFTEEGVTTKVRTLDNSGMTKGILKKKSFIEYETIGEIFIKDAKKLLDIIKTFSEIINLEKIEEHFLSVFQEDREVYTILAEKKVCDNIVEEDVKEDFGAVVTTKIEKPFLDTVVKDMVLFNQSHVKINKIGENLSFQIGKEDESDYSKNIMKCETGENFSVNVGASFKEAVSILGDDITFSLGSDKPLVIKDVSDDMIVKILIAPFVDGDD